MRHRRAFQLSVRAVATLLIPIGDDLYVFTGLDHMGLSDGALHVIESYADMLVGLCCGVAWIHAPWRMKRPPGPADEIPVVTYWTRQ